MSSKAEKTSNYSHQQSRLNIFFRSPLLLKIVAWIGSLSFLGSTGMAWADLQPPSTSKTEGQELIQASVSKSIDIGAAKLEDKEVYGPYLPIVQKPFPVQINSAQLPNREIPVAVAPASAVILPTGTIVRPQHTDLLVADNLTVGVNESTSAPKITEESIDISVPAPLLGTMPGRSREIVSPTRNQLEPSYVKPQSVISQSVPTTSIQAKSKSASSVTGYRSVPAVANLPASSILQRVGRSTASSPKSISPQFVPLAGLKPTVVAPMKPAVKAPAAPAKLSPTLAVTPIQPEYSIEIAVPTPRNQRVEVQAVAHLPQINELKSVPTVPAIPSVRPAALTSQSGQPIAFVNTGESRTELGYPLSSPAPTTSSFGWRTHPITGSRRFHSGVDIGAPMGAPVVAAATGIIISSGWKGGYGKAIVIQHNGVQQTLYGHLSEVFVQPGQRIERGTVIGRVGSTGNSTGPHLHFESRAATADGWVAVDPGEEIKYALDNLHRAITPFAQRDLPPGYN